MATSQTFPTFVHPSSSGPSSSLVASSMEAAVSTQPNQVQVTKLYQLLIENPRLLEKPVKYRCKSAEGDTLQQEEGLVSSSGLGSSGSSTVNRGELGDSKGTLTVVGGGKATCPDRVQID
ncbi:hypothetical protein pipiens_016742 [Culex pipiens pipiens]|uniref:Uncharacterized protein n=1 Tax=Culex pipiens pipiens TaxID=38569 RepID=A0ABD1CJX1_CULPP